MLHSAEYVDDPFLTTFEHFENANGVLSKITFTFSVITTSLSASMLTLAILCWCAT